VTIKKLVRTNLIGVIYVRNVKPGFRVMVGEEEGGDEREEEEARLITLLLQWFFKKNLF
jgi:hypothetical protein